MTCDRWLPMLLLAAEGRLDELDAVERDGVTAHLAECPQCREALKDQRVVAEALKRRGDAPVPTGFLARVVSLVGRRVRWADQLSWRTWTVRLVPVAVGLLLLAFVAAPERSDSTTTVGLPELVNAWAFGTDGSDALPAFALLGQENVSGDELLDVILSNEPDEPITVGDVS